MNAQITDTNIDTDTVFEIAIIDFDNEIQDFCDWDSSVRTGIPMF